MAKFDSFDKSIFTFLSKLEKNNNRDWFNENKGDYEAKLREPALDFVRTMDAHMDKISPHFVASDKKSGGSLMRIYRDTRFSKDKTPYKTNVGIHFKHEEGKDVHAPGYYLHLANDGNFLGVGMYGPETAVLTKVRTKIVNEPDRYKKIINAKKFKDTFDLGGSSLKRAPKGFDKDHPLVDELKRKSFIAVCDLTKKEVTSDGFVKLVTQKFKAATPLMEFLCEAVEVDF